MFRTVTVIALLATLYAALFNCAECWVIAKADCTAMTSACEEQATMAAFSPCQGELEKVSRSSCCSTTPPANPASAQRSRAEKRDSGLPDPPCPNAENRAGCCILVHPFWFGPPAKLSLFPLSLSGFPPNPRPQPPTITTTTISTLHIPPWGVHPEISTTVLRI